MENDALVRLEALPDVLTIREVATVLRCSESTIRRRLRACTFPIRPLPGIDKRRRFARADLLRFLESGGRVKSRVMTVR